MSHLSPPPPTASLSDEQALDWFVRQQRGLSREEQAQHRAWLASDEAHRAAYARWQASWDTLDQLPADGLAALNAQLAKDLQALGASDLLVAPPASSPALPRSSTARRGGWRQWAKGLLGGKPSAPGRAARPLRWAAPALVLLMLAGGYGGWASWQRQPLYSAEHVTARGQQSRVQLPDGSMMRLDTLTQTDVTLYRQRREVRLSEGQVVFQVTHDASRPFQVLAGPLRITVVGTRFSVRYTAGTPGRSDVRVAVEEGRVRVEPIEPVASPEGSAKQGVELTAGEQIASDAHGGLGAVSAVPATGIAPWRDNRVSFDNTPLDQALAEFERYGATRLRVQDPAVAALRLTGTFDPLHLENFVRALPQVLPVRLVPDPMAKAGTAASTSAGPWLVVGR
ncbi:MULTISPECIES: FecR domain-containing protein [unclassified Variovorax]|uniref:FecR family protein n=1 Tax=unclassified Variovorax TaxID=663243 RepID=UPI002576F5DD|nr:MULTISPECIES: FecR domain-containing protein [unclassified Variovorax]MDM0086289.1 FecR domain-containing protein [Variovorax sp. J22G40]MDM0145454.1 FecR domain-containing protein [Variovorax sp. J2P1-31]